MVNVLESVIVWTPIILDFPDIDEAFKFSFSTNSISSLISVFVFALYPKFIYWFPFDLMYGNDIYDSIGGTYLFP